MDQSNLHKTRVELVRNYLHNPQHWPDSIDWPNWSTPHDIWFTGHEEYWIPLAIAEQERRDTERERAELAPKRKPLIPPKPGTLPPDKLARAKATNQMLGNAKKLLQAAKERAAEQTQAHTATSKADVASKPKAKYRARPNTREPSKATLRKRRERERKKLADIAEVSRET